jgi:hypothetical protein
MSSKVAAALLAKEPMTTYGRHSVLGYVVVHRKAFAVLGTVAALLAIGIFNSRNSYRRKAEMAQRYSPRRTNSELGFQISDSAGLSAGFSQSESMKAGSVHQAPSRGSAGPMIVRTVELSLVARNFESVRGEIETLLSRIGGHVAELNLVSPPGSAKSLTVSLRIPAERLDNALGQLRNLGRVVNESQRGEEVTQRYVDIEANLANSRNTEARLTEILRTRTGKLSEVLEVEEQLSRVRREIETSEAEQKNLSNQIAMATVSLRVDEEYAASLNSEPAVSAWTRARNAGIDGIKTLEDAAFELLLWLMEAGPSLLVIAGLLFFPVRWAWKKRRPSAVDGLVNAAEMHRE